MNNITISLGDVSVQVAMTTVSMNGLDVPMVFSRVASWASSDGSCSYFIDWSVASLGLKRGEG